MSTDALRMRPWIRRTLGLLPIIGSGAGLTVIAAALAGMQSVNWVAIVIMVVFAAIYTTGAIAGLLLLEGHRHAVALNLMFWLLQTLQLVSPVVTYILWSPTNLGAWYNVTSAQAGLSYQVGSTFQFSLLNAGSDTAIAVNLVAVVCVVYLYLLYRRQYSSSRNPG